MSRARQIISVETTPLTSENETNESPLAAFMKKHGCQIVSGAFVGTLSTNMTYLLTHGVFLPDEPSLANLLTYAVPAVLTVSFSSCQKLSGLTYLGIGTVGLLTAVIDIYTSSVLPLVAPPAITTGLFGTACAASAYLLKKNGFFAESKPVAMQSSLPDIAIEDNQGFRSTP